MSMNTRPKERHVTTPFIVRTYAELADYFDPEKISEEMRSFVCHAHANDKRQQQKRSLRVARRSLCLQTCPRSMTVAVR